MKILQVCPRVPWPLNDGGNIAMSGLAEMLLKAGHSITVFALNTKKHHINTSLLPTQLSKEWNLLTAEIDTTIRPFSALINLFKRGESYNVIRFYDEKAEASLKKLLAGNTFDIVILESLFTLPYVKVIRENSRAIVLLRAHNVEHVIWKRLADRTENNLRRTYIRFLYRRLKNLEDGLGRMLDGFLPITDVDAAYFESIAPGTPLHILPVCVDTDRYPLQDTAGQPIRLFHLGSMDWMPNVEAVEWFLESCWGSIHERFPGLELHLAGRSYPEQLMRSKDEGVHCQGTVDDAMEYMRDKQVMIVPLLSGSGMRVKILQGMACGKTIISTRIGCEGIPVSDGENILLADTPEQFLEQVSRCMKDPDFARRIGRNARSFAEDNFSMKAGIRKLEAFLGETVSRISDRS